MMHASGRPATRPRPPARRKSSQSPQPLDVSAQAHIKAHDVAPFPRSALSDVTNSASTDTAHTVTAEDHVAAITQHGEGAESHRCNSQTLSPSSSASELDHARLEGLERHELEQMLIEASRKMREREAKLVFAASIGKALLEKNMSLRSGIETSIASSSSLYGLSDIESIIHDFSTHQRASSQNTFDGAARHRESSSPRPMYSPPTTDVDVHSLPDLSPSRAASDTTPLAHPTPLPAIESDYFSRPSHQAKTRFDANAAFAAETSTTYNDRSIWIPSDAGLIASQPCSPSASISSYASHALLSPQDAEWRIPSSRVTPGSRHRSRPSLLQIQALEAQRQLASLGEQNDVLHQQISELQHEAENARFEGSKRLSRLNRELRGLKAELEAATRRNVELESDRSVPRPSPVTRSPAKGIAVGSRHPHSHLTFRKASCQESALSSPASSKSTGEPEPARLRHGLIPSTSKLEDMVRSVHAADGESALLAQLLAKIRELEETNSAMAKAEEDFGSRMGRAMQEDERLRDAFNTVGQDLAVTTAETVAETSPEKMQKASELALITPSHSLQSLDSIASAEVGSPSSPLSPSQRRRAPGNRHVIEQRKTVRSALRRAKKELAADIWGFKGESAHVTPDISRSSTEASLGTYSVDLSASSSASSSPQPARINRKASSSSLALGIAVRPRIRITPSIEDLGQRRKTHEQIVAGPEQECPSSPGDWQDVTSPTLPNAPQTSSLSPRDAMKASFAHLKVGPRLGRAHHGGPNREMDKSNRLADAAPTSSPSLFQQTAFRPTARVRRSRSRSSSFGSHFQVRQTPVSVQQSPDPFASPSPAWHRPGLARSPSSNSSHRGRTLGSELGSIFGGDDRKHDFDDDLPQHRRLVANQTDSNLNMRSLVLHRAGSMSALDLRSNVKNAVVSDRPTANVGRLVPQSDEEQHDDLECVLTQPVYGQIEDDFSQESPLRPRDAALLVRIEAEEDGMWLADQPIIESGGLPDKDEPRSAQFDLINAAVEHQAVAWADDDDYGRTISQREAVKLGLLAYKSSVWAARSMRTLTARSKSDRTNADLAKASNVAGVKKLPFRLEIESSEQVEDRLRIESILRRRRQELLHERGFVDDWEDEADVQKQEAELVATYAPSPQRLQERRLKALAGHDSSLSPGKSSPTKSDPRRSTQQWVRDLVHTSPSRRGGHNNEDEEQDMLSLNYVGTEEADFELLDCPSWKRQGGRGTDYFPTSFRARYRPAMVKQRVAHASQVTLGWVEEWVQFAFVVFLAFVVMVEQGPDRGARRGRRATNTPQLLLNKSE
ncbi:hypothetical protein PHSY_001585 [Pseudozyma hubeiensis SY62]|uniref:Uncharacterized protein n=1 Tax=Pseudozyma hubeiensis (strain SY62) TaxID=1305764 RepID=R9NZ56_PSEHS|nr:hypothetical protein PHSY_001585 [Pseudozyma hubeiensis SY62]GAC94016.1 hypothetical protein PHSY_001585 [Pseudozyma hubeiensis SY62]